MDTAAEYRVAFSGHVLDGFEPEKVRDSLKARLRLSDAQAARLFDGQQPHTLKRTDSEDEARRFTMLLAQLGAVAKVEPVEKPAATAQGNTQSTETPPKPTQKRAQTRGKRRPLPRYSPLPGRLPLAPLLYMAVGFELLLALLYVLLMAAMGLGTLYYSLFSLWGAELMGDPLLGLLVQVLVLPLGLLVLLVLAKPLLSLYRRRHRGIRLPEGREPQLHRFVGDLCRQLQLKPPTAIRLNNDPFVSMFYHRGVLGFWRGEGVLVIGMPVLAALNSSQLAASIAQTMSLFGHRKALRSSSLLLQLMELLQRSVYRDDLLSRGVKRWRDEGRLSPAVTGLLLRLFTLSRKLQQARLALSRSLYRRLVHRLVADADKYALALAGSDGFAALLEQQRILCHAMQELEQQLCQQWQEKGELPEDWLHLLLHRMQQYPADTHLQVLQQHEQWKADTADVIPSDAQRIKSLSRQRVAAGLADLSPARAQIEYFPKLALTMTMRFYHNRLGLAVTPDRLVHHVVKGSEEAQLNGAVERFFMGVWHPRVPLKLGLALQVNSDAEEARRQWQNALKTIEHDANRTTALYHGYLEAEENRLDSSLKETLYGAELWQQVGEGKLTQAELEDFHRFCRENEQASDEALTKLRQALHPYAQRLGAAMAMLHFSASGAEERIRYEKARALIAVYDRIESLLPTLRELKLHTALLKVLLSYRSVKRQPRLDDRINEVAADIEAALTAIRITLMKVKAPFARTGKNRNLFEHLLRGAYTDETVEGTFDRGNDAVIGIDYTQRQLLARLISLAEEMEKAHLRR